MLSHTSRLLLAILAIAVLSSVPVGAATKEERKRKKAFEEAQDAFKKDFRSEDPKVRREAVKRLLPFTDLGAGRFLVEEVLKRETNPGVLNAVMGVVAATKDEGLVDWFAAKALSRTDWRIRTSVVEALGHMDGPKVTATLMTLLKKEKESPVLSMALFGVANLRLKAALDAVIVHLEHEDWQVRVAAIEALTELKEERSIPALIDRLMNETGRLREDLAEALRSITGKDFGRDANAWRKWFHEKDSAPQEEPDAKPPAGGGSVVKEPTYFGIKVVSERVLFVLDLSLSMKTPIDIDKMKVAREAALTGRDEDGNRNDEKFENTIKWWKIKDRLDLAVAQLQFVIKNLGSKQQFEMVTFSEKVTPWNAGRLMKASRLAKIKASQYLETVEVEGATGIGAALDFAFEMAGPGAFDKNYHAGVDTIFVLSDGAPTDRSAEEILEQITHRNRLRKIKIHVVAIMNYSVEFLRLLAERNGGTYKFFKVEDKR